MIQIARIYDPAKKSDGWRVLVDRLWPRAPKKGSGRGWWDIATKSQTRSAEPFVSGRIGDNGFPDSGIRTPSFLFEGWRLPRMAEIDRDGYLPETGQAIFCMRRCTRPGLRISRR